MILAFMSTGGPPLADRSGGSCQRITERLEAKKVPDPFNSLERQTPLRKDQESESEGLANGGLGVPFLIARSTQVHCWHKFKIYGF
jgi:hypothetical protein